MKVTVMSPVHKKVRDLTFLYKVTELPACLCLST